MGLSICVSCKKSYIRNPRQKKQMYCSDPNCQKARKAKWQREQMKSNVRYRNDQIQAKKDWFDQHPDFWKKYRKKHPQKTLRNSLLQRKRNQQHRLKRLENSVTEKVIAKMDVLRGYLAVTQGKKNHFF